MKTTVDIDESVLRAAEAQARHQGKPLAALVEQALRMTVNSAAGDGLAAMPPQTDQGLEDNDPFFAALDEIRNAGRQAASHREVHIE
jgi:hypothetical protein